MSAQGAELRTLPYMPQLDGLRALAVFAVLYTHFLAKDYSLSATSIMFWFLWRGLGLRCVL